ncbi:hypothetical protein [Nitrincola alkalilacustris]|uniref:hypothetical protein n=1 Tax=Nitrincola alkalilacustris TaxID=1571224 RepID=UPI001F0DC1D1|nr:hypothetical protein [Nitrincola alkalilacustris]
MIRKRYTTFKYLLYCLSLMLLSGCATPGDRPFNIKSLAKTDIDMVADAHVEEVTALARELTIKLYLRNPREMAKGPPGMTLDQRLDLLFSSPRLITHPELNNRYGVDAVPLAFDPAFQGDRVFALMVGISGMLHAAYNYKDTFYILDEINQQKLYNSARNIEVVVWQLSNRRQSNGELFLLTNGLDEYAQNLSFERLFGKLIAHQDMMARIISDKTNRSINKVVHSVASFTLLPI